MTNDEPLPELQRGKTIRQYFSTTFGHAYEPDEKSVYKKKKKDQKKIFVSHPNGHKLVKDRMHGLSDYLRKKTNFCPWCDKDHLGPSGRDLDESLVKSMIQALEECDLIIVGLPEGFVSNWIIAENRQAKTMKKRILIVNFGKAKIKAGMVRSLNSGYVRVDPDMKKKEFYRKTVEAIEDNLSHPLKYQDFRDVKVDPREKYKDLELDDDDIIL